MRNLSAYWKAKQNQQSVKFQPILRFNFKRKGEGIVERYDKTEIANESQAFEQISNYCTV